MADTPQTGAQIPLPRDGRGSLAWWQEAIEAAEKPRDDLKSKFWVPNLNAYEGQRKKKTDDDVPVNVDYYNTEQKKAQLCFRVPEVVLSARRPQLEDAVAIFQPVINHYLGSHGVNAMAMAEECAFDGICPSGIWASVIGYEAIEDGTVPVQVGMQPDPQWTPPPPAPGSILGLAQPPMQAPQVPQMQDVPNIVSERYFWDRLSPAAVIIPLEFGGSDYDKAAYLGRKYPLDLELAKAKGWVDAHFTGGGEDKYRMSSSPEIENRGPLVIVTEVWYRAAQFDPSVKHPEKIRQLVLIEGLDAPAVHRDSPYQRFDPSGKCIGGMKGFPIHLGALRYVSDKAYPPSDCTVSRFQVDELCEGRGQMVQQRKRSLPLRGFDRNRVGNEDIDRLKRGEIQGLIPCDGNGSEIFFEIARAEWPRENFTFNNVIQQDIDKEWALGSNQQGVTEDTVRSATELQLIQSNINTRMDFERNKFNAWFARGAEKLGALIQLFADQTDYVEILGEDGEKRLEAWDKTRIQGEFAYAVKPDSNLRVDAPTDQKQWMNWTNFTAKSPMVNQMENMRIGAEKFGYDPQRVLQQPQAPPPDKPNVSFRFGGADLAIPEVRQLLGLAGIQLSPQPSPQAMLAQQEQAMKGQPHPGTADKADILSKHSGDETGQLPGPTTAKRVA